MKKECEAIIKNAFGTIDLNAVLKEALEKEMAKAIKKEMYAKFGVEVRRVEILEVK